MTTPTDISQKQITGKHTIIISLWRTERRVGVWFRVKGSVSQDATHQANRTAGKPHATTDWPLDAGWRYFSKWQKISLKTEHYSPLQRYISQHLKIFNLCLIYSLKSCCCGYVCKYWGIMRRHYFIHSRPEGKYNKLKKQHFVKKVSKKIV